MSQKRTDKHIRNVLNKQSFLVHKLRVLIVCVENLQISNQLGLVFAQNRLDFSRLGRVRDKYFEYVESSVQNSRKIWLDKQKLGVQREKFILTRIGFGATCVLIGSLSSVEEECDA